MLSCEETGFFLLATVVVALVDTTGRLSTAGVVVAVLTTEDGFLTSELDGLEREGSTEVVFVVALEVAAIIGRLGSRLDKGRGLAAVALEAAAIVGRLGSRLDRGRGLAAIDDSAIRLRVLGGAIDAEVPGRDLTVVSLAPNCVRE